MEHSLSKPTTFLSLFEKKINQEHTLLLQLKKYITFPNVLRIDFDIFKLQISNILWKIGVEIFPQCLRVL